MTEQRKALGNKFRQFFSVIKKELRIKKNSKLEHQKTSKAIQIVITHAVINTA